MGFALASNGVGGAVAAQMISPLIYEEGNPFGYRKAYLLTAAFLLIVGGLIVLFIKVKEAPADTVEAGQSGRKKGRGQEWVGIEFQEIVRTVYFVIAAVCVFLTGMCLQSVSGVMAAHMKDVGLDAAYVANVLSISSLALTLSKLLTGMLYDRFSLRLTMLICDVAAIVNIFILAILTNSPAASFLAMFYGIFIAFAMPLETIIIPFVASELFGKKSYAKGLGILVSINTAGYAFGTPIINLVYDSCGTYRPVLLVLSGLMLAVTVSFQLVLRKARDVKASYTY